MAIPVTAIFDIGKTNKKFFLFDEGLNEVYHEYQKLPLITDDDGFACDDLDGLANWIKETVATISNSKEYRLKGINFSTYGATLVHLDEHGKPVTPLYNYLKPFPEELLAEFCKSYPEDEHNLVTASPKLGMLNSGLQLYWLKKTKPEVFKKIRHTLHFPQYLSYLFTGQMVTEPTSIGCHTKLWDFTTNQYHTWLTKEKLDHLFPPLVPTTHSFEVPIQGNTVNVGVGIHDSSSALASYLMRSQEPFILISTGTWSITLNAFTTENLTAGELTRDCLNYLTIHGKPVKASRLFLGNELDYHVNQLNEIFHKEPKYYKQINLNKDFIKNIDESESGNTFYPHTIDNPALVSDIFKANTWNPSACATY
jgi:L-fuculokinase